MQPFHEYECTGIKDQYVVFVKADEPEDELKKEYSDCKEDYECFSDFISDYYGYIIDDSGAIGRWTNPNKQWDWWTIGGRWPNRLISKSGSVGDQFYKKDVDFDAMKKRSVSARIQDYEKAQAAFNGESFISWRDIMKDGTISRDDQKEKYNSQPAIIRFKEVFDSPFVSAEIFNVSRDDFIKKSEFEGVSAFAILHDGKWLEKGSMGWWGCVSDEKESSEWEDVYMKALSHIPDDNYLVVIDCHI